jgi:CysZ protein
MFGIAKGFWMGFGAPLRAIGMILKSPRMLALITVPLSVNIALYVVFFHYGSNYLGELVTMSTASMAHTLPPALVSVSGWALKILGWLILALAAALTFTFVSGLVAAPFNDSLSRAALNARLRQMGSGSSAHEKYPVTETIGLELKRMLVLLAGAIVAFVLGIIPLLQLPALALGAFLVSFEYFGYPLSHRTRSLWPVALFTLRHPAVSLGFGAFLLLIMALPFTSILYIPLAVVGGTVLYADLTTPGADTRKRI